MNHFNRKKPPKTKKEDISGPQNFEHRKHIGLEDVKQTDSFASGMSTEFGSDGCQKSPMSRNVEELLEVVIKVQQETLERITILEAKTDQIVTEIGRINTAKPVVRAGSREHASYENTTEDQYLAFVNNANAMARYSKTFKSMPDLSSSDEHRQDKQSSLPRYKKTADGRRPLEHRTSSIKKKVAVQKSYSKPGLAIRRECMSQALQANIVLIVEGLEFTQSTLPEQLIQAGHMTEEECNSVRTDKSRKDQIRYIVSRTKSRSLQDMEQFLVMIGQQIPQVVNKIWDQYESNLKRNDTSVKCMLCLCFENIDVKEIVDELWSTGAVPDSFYRDAINCSKPRGCQENLWQELIYICNNKQTAEKQKAFNILFEYIKKVGKSGGFDFIVTGLKSMFEAERKLTCHCQMSVNVKSQLSERESNASSKSYSSLSPRSSASDERRSLRLSDDLYKETDIDEDNQRTHRKIVRQSSMEDDMAESTIPKEFAIPRAKIYQSKSLEMLDTIREDTDTTFKKVPHTLEFHHPVRVQVDYEGAVPVEKRRTNSARTANENRTRRYGSEIRIDDTGFSIPYHHGTCV